MSSPKSKSFILAVWAMGTLGCFLIMIGLVYIMYYYTQPPPVDEARAAERRKNLAELNAAAKEQLENYGWMDQAKGIARVPIDKAMELTLKEWKEASAPRATLLANLARAAIAVTVTNQTATQAVTPAKP